MADGLAVLSHTPSAEAGTARDRLLGWRDRLIASPRFQEWVARTPLLNLVARRRARQLFDLTAGFVYSQVLYACVQLRLFDSVRVPQTAPALAARLSMPLESMQRLLAAAVALGLIQKRGGEHYGLGRHGAALLGNPGVTAMIEHHGMLYADLSDPVALLRGTADTELARYWAYRGDAPDRSAAYTALMAASQHLVARDVLSAYPIGRHRCLLDVGGGDGTFLTAVSQAAPLLRLMLFELPSVTEHARGKLQREGLAARVTLTGGDFLSDALPAGADVITLVRVVHDHDDEAALRLLCAVRRALPSDGVLLLAEPLAGVPGAETVGDAYFGFYLLAMGQGRARSTGELTQLLKAAGFGRIDTPQMPRPLQTGLIVAHADARVQR